MRLLIKVKHYKIIKKIGKFGTKSKFIIYDGIFPWINAPEKIQIGNDTHIGGGFFFDGSGGLLIGDHVHIAPKCSIYTSNHNFKSDKAMPYDETYIEKGVTIENYVWIGINVNIAPGVKIGQGAIVGMGSVVTKNVPQCAIVGGNPAQIIGYRDKNVFYKLTEKS
ncbi:acyltransferase [Clostridium akagii]|uniref:acyltransferase n=1 Tax=Clostridium akagii TaxID=91623 RepID=UPI00055E1246|nr:acyltransferase [Clostridium akagii]